MAECAEGRRMADTSLESLLYSEIVLTSEELVKKLIQAGRTPAAARQALQRASASGRVWKSEHCRLPQNMRLYALPNLVGSNQFFRVAARKVAQSERHGIARCMAALAQDKVLLDTDAKKLLAAPVAGVETDESNHHLSFRDELAALGELGVHASQLMYGQEYLTGTHFDESLSGDVIALKAVSQIRIECMLARIVVDSLRRQNVLAWNQYNIALGDCGYVVFNAQLFTAQGYCYLWPVLRWEGKKTIGCPVLLDVYAGECRRFEVEAFVERIKRATFRNHRQQNHLGIIAATSFPKEAFDYAKEHHLLTMNLRQVFGDQALDALVQIETLLRNLDFTVTPNIGCDVQKFSRLLEELKTNPVVTILRSIGYEALCALILRSVGYEGVEMGCNVPFKESTRDVDVFGRRGKVLRVVECKALTARKELESCDVRKFYLETLPAFQTWYSRKRGMENSVEKIQAEIWTTGEIGFDAKQQLNDLQLATYIERGIKTSKDIETEIPTELRERIQKLLTAIAMPVNKEQDSNSTNA
jgi:hypothetical protein